jgi:murein DD-endopeptidase MepM/ murein hydrolase activator NlpD
VNSRVKLTLTFFVYRNRPQRGTFAARGTISLYQNHEATADTSVANLSGNAAALAISQAIPAAIPSSKDVAKKPGLPWRDRLAALDLVPDMGDQIGSRTWWRSAATLLGLCAAAVATYPGVKPFPATGGPKWDAADFNESRAQTIMPLAFGGDSGRHMGATDAVRPLAETPERPQIELTASLGRGDSFARVLERSGVSKSDAQTISNFVASKGSLADIPAGTRIHMILGRRSERTQPRPLDALTMRARFDLRIEMERVGGEMVMRAIPIAVDHTPLRIKGRVGDSLFRSARAAGAPAEAVQSYLRVIGSQINVGRDVKAGDEFDIIVEYRRAETGEAEVGKLLYAGLGRGGKSRLSMLQWNKDGKAQWFEASGVGQKRGGITRPSNGRISSSYGMRRHPILGYSRMHAGIDFAGGYGGPIFAVSDGVVTVAGRHGGYGNYVRLNHGGGTGTGYGHMSRIAVRNGQRVKQGQVIGYIGSTGLSTGPHLHYEYYRGGRAVNPNTASFVQRAQLEGRELAAFRSRIASLTSVAPGAALRPLGQMAEAAPTVGSISDVAAKRAAPAAP